MYDPLVYCYENMDSYLYLLLNGDTSNAPNSINDIIILHLYYMWQAYDQIVNLKYESGFVCFKVNEGLLLYYFEIKNPYNISTYWLNEIPLGTKSEIFVLQLK